MKTYIIIGAGILGASTAYHLTKKGVNVVIIDREDSGQATNAAAGMICPWLSQRRNKDWYTLARNGAKFYPKLINELEREGAHNTGYKRVGALSIHTDVTKLDKIEERVRKRLEEAPEIGEIKRLSPKETNALFPLLDDNYHSIYVSGAARVDGKSLRKALLHGAWKNGATFIYGDAKLSFQGTEVTGVVVNKKEFRGDAVIVTAGAWAGEVLSPLGINFLVKPQKAHIIHLHTQIQKTNSWPVIMAPSNKYMLAFKNGKIVVGTTYEDEAGFDEQVKVGAVHEIISSALSIAPSLEDSDLVETKVGFRPVVPEFHPVVGLVPNVKRLFTANGLGASGLTVGPYVGAELAKLVVGEEVEIDLDKYAVNRAMDE